MTSKKNKAKRNTKASANGTAPAEIEPTAAGDPLALEVDGLHYSLDKPPTKNGRKIVARVRLAGGQDGSGFVDSIDLYRFRSRREFAALVADAFGKTVDVVLGQLALLLDQVERALVIEKKVVPLVLTAARKAAAEKLLTAPNLLDRMVKTLDALGIVGEERNKRALILVATSRLLDHPLSVLLRAPAATGKSQLLDAVLALLPEECVQSMTRLTPHALYYAGADALRHKLVVVDEAPGASEADHSIRVLQSAGKLTLAVVVKGKTERFTVHGPVSMLSGTTAASGNAENTSRCLELSLDDSREQTVRILESQRQAWSGEQRAAVNLEVFHDAQRLLEPVSVTIPFAKRLTFPARDTTDRRDQPKMLGLTAAHAVLFQRQRERDANENVIATVDDYRVAYSIFAPLVEAEFEDLSMRAAHVYRLLKKNHAEVSFKRRDVIALTSWPFTTARRAIDELVTHELVRLVRKKAPITYRVVDVPLTESTGLTHPDEVR